MTQQGAQGGLATSAPRGPFCQPLSPVLGCNESTGSKNMIGNRAVLSFTLLAAISACSTAPPKPATTLKQPTNEDDRYCKIDGIFFEELAKQRDSQVPKQIAVQQVSAWFRARAMSDEERKTAASILARAESTANFVYALKPLAPTTMRYFGANVCLMMAAGDRNSENAVKLAQYAAACQRQFPTDSAEQQLRSCITNRAIQLIK